MTPGLQAAFGVSSKHFRKACDRNRIKRIMREAYRLQAPFLKESAQNQQIHLALFIIYSGSVLPEFEAMVKKMEEVLQKIARSIPGGSSVS